jgi:type II secretory pathway component GspD/PulD (secretin)
VEARIIGVSKDYLDDVGIDLSLLAEITKDAGPAAGGTNGHETTLAVSSNASGGPPNLDYLMYGTHRPEGALPILNKDFVSPFTAIKTFPLLPTTGCVLFDAGATTAPQGFPGTTPVENVAPVDNALLNGGEVVYDVFSAFAADQLLAQLQADIRNDVLTAPLVRAYSGQSLLYMLDDVEPSISQVTDEFRTKVQAVTAAPFGVFTGVTLDLMPVVETNGTISLDIRPATQSLTFFFSTAFQVGGTQVDAEIPVHRRGRNVIHVNVESGKTLVLGGLMRMGQPTADKGLPFLGNLPVIGNLFTHKRVDAATQNLVIFVTPTVVNPD